ncbi:MAG: LysM peptidoglycan-binding domain-containing protein [Opitutus sp.]|nr:LysM peptidoglycan-binding domain-containing protein [Opitutus sp.]
MQVAEFTANHRPFNPYPSQMTVRRQITSLLAFAGLSLGAGCGGDSRPLPVETDEPVYRQGQQLVKQGRNPEALAAYLKLIEKRGEQASPESHFAAGLIYLKHSPKDPVEAYHHFRKYLELQPKSKQARGVRDLLDNAMREFARTIPGRVLEDQSVRLELTDQVKLLQRENDALKLELGSLRVGLPLTTLRSSRASAVADESPVSVAPVRSRPMLAEPPVIAPAPAPVRLLAPASASPPTAPERPTARKHTVVPGDTLYKIAVKYYGSGAKVDEVYNANLGAMKNRNVLPPVGTELKVP